MPSTRGDPSSWHSEGGWQPICWGYYDKEDSGGGKWRQVEAGEVGLRQEGVLDVYEVLFGPIDSPLSDDPDAVLAYRRKLVATVGLLFAAVGIGYKVQVACADGEMDKRPYKFMLEGLSGKWVARGIRAAGCGFQLSGDAAAAWCRQEKRRKEAARVRKDDDNDDVSW